MKNYDVVIEYELHDLIKGVNSAIVVGYIPLGGIIQIEGRLIQAIYLKPTQMNGENHPDFYEMKSSPF